MIAYIISLDTQHAQHNQRNEQLLRDAGFDVAFVPGVPGRDIPAVDYYRMVLTYHARTNVLLAPSEAGCSLAHRAAYERVLASGQAHALILEEDALLDGASCQRLKTLADGHLDSVDFLQAFPPVESHEVYPHVRASLVSAEPRILKVNNDDLAQFMGTATYFISREAVRRLLALHDAGVYLADDFLYWHEHAGISGFHYSFVGMGAGYASSLIHDDRLARRIPHFNTHLRSLRFLVAAMRGELIRRARLRWRSLHGKQLTLM